MTRGRRTTKGPSEEIKIATVVTVAMNRKLQRLAAADRRSTSAYLALLIERHLEDMDKAKHLASAAA